VALSTLKKRSLPLPRRRRAAARSRATHRAERSVETRRCRSSC